MATSSVPSRADSRWLSCPEAVQYGSNSKKLGFSWGGNGNSVS